MGENRHYVLNGGKPRDGALGAGKVGQPVKLACASKDAPQVDAPRGRQDTSDLTRARSVTWWMTADNHAASNVGPAKGRNSALPATSTASAGSPDRRASASIAREGSSPPRTRRAKRAKPG